MKQIRCLTSLRFFAAAMIVIFHSVNAFKVWDNRKIPFPLAQGVSFFFVLSGFILTYVYPSLSGVGRVRDFYAARIARIWPAHFVAFLLLIVLIPIGGWVWNGQWQVLVANLSLVQGWIPMASYYFSFNGVSWSISTEAFFYLVFPFLIYRLDRTWWWKLLGTGAFVWTVLWAADRLRLPEYDAANLSTITTHGLAYISPLARILEFVFGMIVSHLCIRARKHEIITLSPQWIWTFFELGAIACILLDGYYGTRFLSSLLSGRNMNAYSVYVGSCGSFLAFGFLIAVLSFERGIVSRILSHGCLVLLGEISYSLYLVHYIIIRWYSQNPHLFSSIPKTMRYIGYWISVLTLSFIIWRWIEKPSQRAIRSLLRTKDVRKIS